MLVSEIFSAGGHGCGGGERHERGHYESRRWYGGGRDYYESSWRGEGRHREGRREGREGGELLEISISDRALKCDIIPVVWSR